MLCVKLRQFLCSRTRWGSHIELVDTGGGMGVDYDGTRSSSSESSVNYSIQEYVNDVVSTFVMLPTNTGSLIPISLPKRDAA